METSKLHFHIFWIQKFLLGLFYSQMPRAMTIPQPLWVILVKAIIFYSGLNPGFNYKISIDLGALGNKWRILSSGFFKKF